MQTSEILNKAADLIVDRGHNKGAYVNDQGNVCALGAIRLVCGGTVDSCQFSPSGWTVSIDETVKIYTVHEVSKALRNYLRGDPDWNNFSDSVPSWNDRNDKDAVVRALRGAALFSEALTAKDSDI